MNKSESLNCFQKINKLKSQKKPNFKHKIYRKKLAKSNTISKIKSFEKQTTIKNSLHPEESTSSQQLKGVQTMKKLVNISVPLDDKPEENATDFSKKFQKQHSMAYIKSNLGLGTKEVPLDSGPRHNATSAYWFEPTTTPNLPDNDVDLLFIRLFSKCFVYLSKIEHLKIKLHKENIESITYTMFKMNISRLNGMLEIKGFKDILLSLNIALNGSMLRKVFWYFMKFRDSAGNPRAPQKTGLTRNKSTTLISNKSSTPIRGMSYSDFRELFNSSKIIIPEVYLFSDWKTRHPLIISPAVSSLMRQIVLLVSKLVLDLSKTIRLFRRFNPSNLFNRLFLHHIQSSHFCTPTGSNLPSFTNHEVGDNLPKNFHLSELKHMHASEIDPHHEVNNQNENSRRKYKIYRSLDHSKSQPKMTSVDQDIVITDFLVNETSVDNRSFGHFSGFENEFTVDHLRRYLDYFNVRYLTEDLMLVMNFLGAGKGSLTFQVFANFVNSLVWNI